MHADTIVDIGPGAGNLGGEILYSGDIDGFLKTQTLTASYLKKERSLLKFPTPKKASTFITLKGASGHNLKHVELKLPLEQFVVITGVSGSGKSSLILQTLYPALSDRLKGAQIPSLPFTSIDGGAST